MEFSRVAAESHCELVAVYSVHAWRKSEFSAGSDNEPEESSAVEYSEPAVG